jgi:hypothetical protein
VLLSNLVLVSFFNLVVLLIFTATILHLAYGGHLFVTYQDV